VAGVNGAMAAYAEWHVYARDAHFRFVSEHGQPRKSSKLLDDPIFKRPRDEDPPPVVGNDDERYIRMEGPQIASPATPFFPAPSEKARGGVESG
jgi:hypothetical protein